MKTRRLLWLVYALGQSLFAHETICKAEDITYEWLSHQPYSSHISHLKFVLDEIKPTCLLEFGMGFSTKFFLDRCDKVLSVEYITEGYGPEYYILFVDLYADFSNWIPIAYCTGYYGPTHWAPYKIVANDCVHRAASYQCATHKHYADIDSSYLVEQDQFVKDLVSCHDIEIAFVDANIYLRGDLVQILFHKVPVILAHDTVTRANGEMNDVYGYSRIVTPLDYEEIFLPGGSGTTAWIVKEPPYTELIQSLKQHASLYSKQ